MFTNDKSALLQSLLFPVLIIIWGIARTVTTFFMQAEFQRLHGLTLCGGMFASEL